VARARWAAFVAVIVMFAAALAGCGSSGSGTKVTKVAIVSPGRYNDIDWTRLAREAFESLVSKLHMRGEQAEEVAVEKAAGALEQVSHDGTQLVIAHDGRYAAAAAAIAEKTKVPELVWGDPHALKPGLVGDIEVSAGEGAYADGVIAAHATIRRRFAIIIANDGGSWEATTWNEMAGAYIAGLRSVYPHAHIVLVRVGSGGQAQPDETEAAALRLMAHGSQAFFALGGAAQIGVLRAIEKNPGEDHYFIGTIGDKQTVDREQIVLSSVLWDFAPTFRRAIADVRAGTFGKHPYRLTVANRGISVLYTGRTPSDAYEDGVRAATKVSRGQITVPSTPTDASVQALLAGNPQG
jgi:basic membrane lipoprotein Med (substrate-binding protein (PBP1-ABC) superfamily)